MTTFQTGNENSAATLKWFDNNLWDNNPNKCFHLIISSNGTGKVKISEHEIENVKYEKLIGIKLGWNVNCDDHLPDICRKAGGKLNALARIAPSIGLFKRYLQLNEFFNSQFSYCPLILDVPPATQIIGK